MVAKASRCYAYVAQAVEHFLGKEEVMGSSPIVGFVICAEYAGVAQLVRASVFQTEGRGFESRLPLHSGTRLRLESP